MCNKILVAYASTHGSTQEVAEAITENLRGGGLAVDLQPARNVRDMEGYGAVVLGAPLYMLRLHKDALCFLSRHQKVLAESLPIAIFAGGPFDSAEKKASEDESVWREVRRQLDRELARFTWLKPVSVEVVGGRFDPSKLRLPWSLLPALRHMPPSDLRDWDAISSWANGLVGLFQPAISH